jgi:hypothetical protein
MDMGQAKPTAYQTAVSENLFYVFRVGICGDIEIFGFSPQQKIPHPPTNKKCLIS